MSSYTTYAVPLVSLAVPLHKTASRDHQGVQCEYIQGRVRVLHLAGKRWVEAALPAAALIHHQSFHALKTQANHFSSNYFGTVHAACSIQMTCMYAVMQACMQLVHAIDHACKHACTHHRHIPTNRASFDRWCPYACILAAEGWWWLQSHSHADLSDRAIFPKDICAICAAQAFKCTANEKGRGAPRATACSVSAVPYKQYPAQVSNNNLSQDGGYESLIEGKDTWSTMAKLLNSDQRSCANVSAPIDFGR
eukprot:361689-Chlamydomonas_euryale.AAC.10